MSIVTWNTTKGSLGTISEGEYYSFRFSASDSDEQSLFYSFISGKLPGGMYVTRDGEFRGVPTILSSVDQTESYAFTVRATNPNGVVADRSFTIIVSNINGPEIFPRPDLIGAWFDGNLIDYQFEATDDNLASKQRWSVIAGDLPPGITLSETGQLYGYADIIGANVTELGYEAAPSEAVVFDALPKSTDKYYNFTIQVTDDYKFSTLNVRLLIVSKSNFTADNAITLINNTFIRIDENNRYNPIILNQPDTLPVLVSGSTFAYKFIAFDPEDENISWTIDELAFSGMDELDAAADQTFAGNGTSGPYNLIITPISAARIVVQINGVLQTATVDYTVAGNNLTFVTVTPSATDVIYVQFISTTTGFDSLLFDQGSSNLPSGLFINNETGWIVGTLPTQTEDLKTYDFNVVAYRTLTPSDRSDPVTFSLTVKREINESIIWNTPQDLGTINNGAISELEVSATHTLGKELEYSIIYQPFRRVPQGLKFLRSGRFIGRVSFRYFSLDGQLATLNVFSTENLSVGMSVQGVGVPSGCRIISIVDSNTIEVSPAIYVTQGTILTFSDNNFSISVSTVSNAISTAIDGGRTTFDQECGFTVKVESVDKTISSTKSFIVRVVPQNLSPYENVYLKALLAPAQRIQLRNILENETVFIPALLYRPDDPYFGLQKNLKLLFVSGLSPNTAANFINSIEKNHYNKSINFGEIKTARALDQNGNVTYEVIYVDTIDTQSYGQSNTQLSITLNNKNNFLFGNNSYDTIYPNSYPNMQYRLDTGIGYANKSTLPSWMTSIQEDGTVLGLVRSVVLAYTKPGAAKLMAYRLRTSDFELNSINFVADRYQWDNYLSQFYNLETNQFDPSRATTFDKFPSLSENIDLLEIEIVDSVINSNIVVIPNSIVVGQGWTVTSVDANLTIPTGTTITNVTGNTLSLSSSITANSGTRIRIDGRSSVDYAVSNPFNSINGVLLTTVQNRFLMDGVVNFAQDEKIIFAKQQNFFGSPEDDGWIDSSGQVIPGYLEKAGGQSTVNKRAGEWKITWNPLPNSGFDSDDAGFDQNSPGFVNSYFDQGNDNEIELVFLKEIILTQTVKVRSGDSYPGSTLQYQTELGEIIPRYIPYSFVNIVGRTAETTFDGGTCVMRAGYITGNSFAGGTTFGNNRDIFVVPESLDKYIKFPQTGVFV